MSILLDLEGQRARQFHVGRQHLDHVHSKSHLQHMMRDLILEAEKWDLAPKPGSLWWTSTHEPDEKFDLSIVPSRDDIDFPLKRN